MTKRAVTPTGEMVWLDDGGRVTLGRVDLDGNPVKRTKEAYPYSYSGFVLKRLSSNVRGMLCDYSDRLQQWDKAKFAAAREAHLTGFRFDNAPTDKLEAFLRHYHGDASIKLVAIMEWCNHASGYPLWSFHYTKTAKKKGDSP